MTNIAEFVAARLLEDEEFASEAIQRQWYATDNFVDGYEGGEIAHFQIKADARHAATWNPTRVLAEVDAKRELLRLHTPTDDDPGGPPYCVECQRYDGTGKTCPTILLLAQPYADHSDYDPAWRLPR